MQDDFNDTYGTTDGRIAPGQTISGVLEEFGDLDAFRLSFPEFGVFRISVEDAAIRNLESCGAEFSYLNREFVSFPRFSDVLVTEPGNVYLRIGGGLGSVAPEYEISVQPLEANIGTSQNDWITYAPENTDVITYGGDGNDMLSFVELDHGVAIGRNTLAAYSPRDYAYGLLAAENAKFVGFEGFTGTIYDDFFMPQFQTIPLEGSSTASLRLRGLSGDDTFGTTTAAAIYDGGTGSDTVTYSTPISGIADESDSIHVSLLRGRGWGDQAQGDTYISIENVTGSWGSDVLTGDRGDNVVRVGSGEDTLIGNAGDDTIEGGSGPWYASDQDDVAIYNYDRALYDITRTDVGWHVAYTGPGAGDGVDQISGIEILRFADDEVRVTAEYSGVGAPQHFVGGSLSPAGVFYNREFFQTSDNLSASLLAGVGWTGQADGDSFDRISNLGGGLGNDLLIGDHLDNWLDGVTGNDTLVGNGGNDTLYGTEGYDVAVFSYDRDRYFVGEYATNVLVHDLGAPEGGGDGFDTLYDIDVLRFADGDFIL